MRSSNAVEPDGSSSIGVIKVEKTEILIIYLLKRFANTWRQRRIVMEDINIQIVRGDERRLNR